MKTLFLLLFISTISTAQIGKKKYYEELEKLKVDSCTIENQTFRIGDTISIGFPYGQHEKFSFILRKYEYSDIWAMTNPETLKLNIGYANKKVIITSLYFDKKNPQNGSNAEFKIVDNLFAWIVLENAIASKEIVKINGKPL